MLGKLFKHMNMFDLSFCVRTTINIIKPNLCIIEMIMITLY